MANIFGCTENIEQYSRGEVMAVQEIPTRRSRSITPSLEIEASPAHEFLVTLEIAEDKDKCGHSHELEDQWFEMMREKATPELLNAIREVWADSCEGVRQLVGLAYDCPPPRDVPGFLAHLEAVDPFELRLHMFGYYQRRFRRNTPLDIILQAAEGDEEAQEQFLKTSFPEDTGWQRTLRYLFTQDPIETKKRVLNILESWYEHVFRDLEQQIMPIIERDAEAKRALSQVVSLERLVDVATNGFELVPEPGLRKVVLIPSYIDRPWNHVTEYQDAKIFIYPVADESIAEDASTPPVRLVRLIKALADERRLRILKKLTTGSYTLQEIADDFGAAKTTVHHHLAILRAAGLVRVQSDEKLYSLRQSNMPDINQMINSYLKK
jgi:DNA-binding transcriptional ArsR family regulator